MTDKLYLITEAQRDDINAALQIPEHVSEGEHKKSIAMLQSLPMVTGEPENKDVVELYGMKNGIQVHLGQAPTPPRMKAKEIVISVFGHFDEHDDMDDGDAALCFSCMTELIEYMQKLHKPSPQALTALPEPIFTKVADGIELGHNLWGGIAIRLGGEFTYVQVNYNHEYTDNATRARLADNIVKLIQGEVPRPAVLTKISADDVTDEMLKEIELAWQHPNATDCTHDEFCKKAVAISYNAVIKHRSES